MADMLADKCSQSVDATTIAKIEAGRRSVRINEAVALADIFEVSVDALLGRREPDDTTLTFALVVLTDYAGDAGRQIYRTRGVATDIADQLELIEESFPVPGIDALRQAAQEMAGHLDAAWSNAKVLSSLASIAIVEASKDVPESGPMRGRSPNR